MLQCILSKIKSLLLSALHLVSRLFCCLRRRRRSSDPVIPVSVASSVSREASRLVNEVAGATNWDDDDWDNCEVVIDKPRTTSDHIAAYRQTVTAVRQPSVPEAQLRFERHKRVHKLFQNMWGAWDQSRQRQKLLSA